MTGLYLTFLILGLLVFVVAIFGNFDHDFGHDFHIGDHDLHGDMDQPGLFSIRTISAFLAGFGVSGLVAKLSLGWGVGGQLFLGFFSGLAMAALVFLIMKAFMSQQAGTVKDSKDLVGKTAIVTTGVGTQGIGECRVENNHYTFREKNGATLLPNEVAKVVEAEVGLLVVEKI
jgi:membrane protein implicated in regulation of membrane protease activity